VKTRLGAETEKSQQIIQGLVSVFFILAVLFPGIDHRYGWSNIPYYFVITGDILVILGLSIIFFVFRENRFASTIIEVGRGQSVVQTGPYAFVRHPMYSGALLMLLGIPLALGSWWDFLFVFLIFLAIIWRLSDEERFLTKNLPGYTFYRTKVRFRLIPYVW